MSPSELMRAQSKLDVRTSAIINALVHAASNSPLMDFPHILREALVVLAEELERHGISKTKQEKTVSPSPDAG